MYSKSRTGNNIIILSIFVVAMVLISGGVGFWGINSAGVRFTFSLLIIISAFLVLMLGLFAARHSNKWLMQYAEALKKGTDGDLTVRIYADKGDELGRLGADFNIMTGKLSGMIGRINISTEELTRISNNLSETSKQVINAAQRQADGVGETSSAMTQINASVKGVGQGIDSLSLSAAESSSSIMEMAASIEEVALNVETLTNSVEEVSSSIVEMATSIKHIDSSVMSLTEAFTTTASSVMEMDSSIRQVEKSAMDTAAISEEVRRDAETGKEAVVAKFRARSNDQLLADGMALGGNPDSICRQVEQWAEAGLDQMIFVLQAGNTTHDQVLRSIDLIGEKVLPRFEVKAHAAA